MMHDDLFSVKDEIVVVTGGLGQLGQQFSLALLECGAKVAILDRSVSSNELDDIFLRFKENDQLIEIEVDVYRTYEGSLVLELPDDMVVGNEFELILEAITDDGSIERLFELDVQLENTLEIY